MWSRVKQFFIQNRGVWVATSAIAGFVILLRFSGILQDWEWTTYDLYNRLRPFQGTDRRVAIVGIDEKDISNLQKADISDGILAELLEKIKAMKPRSIGLDLYRDIPINPGHEALVKVFETTPNLVGIQKVAGEAGLETVKPPPILKDKGQIGANDLLLDADNKIRRGFLYLSDGKETVYSFSLHLAGHYLEKEGVAPQEIPGTDRWQIGKAVFIPFNSNDGGYVRADARGFQFLINYRGGKQRFETVSMTDILNNRVASDWGRDRVILIGKVGESFKDFFFTPYSNVLGLSQTISGVEIHANLTSQIISAALDGRPLIRTWPKSLEWAWILFWSGVGATISWQFRHAGTQRKVFLLRWVVAVVAGAILFGSTYGAFLLGWWLPAVPPFIALAGSAVVITAYVAHTAVEIRKTFGRYLTDQVVANLLENPAGSSLGGERREITILTSDLRGFTATAERLTPEEVIKILNLYLSSMIDVITKYQGTIDEFMGDGILVLFGAPVKQKDDPKRAVACALEMQLAMGPINQQMQAWGFADLEMGIAVNTGEVIVGNIGSEKRTKYGIVGSQVNLTYRIESYSTGGQVLISETTLNEVGEEILINERKEVQSKGVKQPIAIYDIWGMKGKYDLQLTRQEEVFLTLAEAIPIQYVILEGKQTGNTFFQGSLLRLSPKGAKILLDKNKGQTTPADLTNVKLNLLLPDRPSLMAEDVYAKVLDTESKESCFRLHFTAKSPAIESYLNSLYEITKNNQ